MCACKSNAPPPRLTLFRLRGACSLARLASPPMSDLPDYIVHNREMWDKWAVEYIEAGEDVWKVRKVG